MNIFAIIGLEAIAWMALTIAFIFFDEPLARWEARTWKRIKRFARALVNALREWLHELGEGFRWRTRRVRREICAHLLAKDGLTIQGSPAAQRDLDATFREVMRLLGE